MPLDGDTLGDAIKSALDGLDDDPTKTEFWRAVGNAVVDHITSHAVVNVTSVSGVTTGGGTSGPGSGTVS